MEKISHSHNTNMKGFNKMLEFSLTCRKDEYKGQLFDLKNYLPTHLCSSITKSRILIVTKGVEMLSSKDFFQYILKEVKSSESIIDKNGFTISMVSTIKTGW